MAFRDDRDAQLARAAALERDLERTREELGETSAERDELLRELAELRKKIGDDPGPPPTPEPSAGFPPKATGTPPVVPLTLLALAAVMLIGGIAYYVLAVSRPPDLAPTARADAFATVCPIREGEPLVLIDQFKSDRRTYHYFYNLYDAATGNRTLREPLLKGDSHKPICYGYEGDLVWMKTKEHGLHARRLATGEVVHREADIEKLAPSEVHELRFDKNGNHVVIKTKDGRRYHVIAGATSTIEELPGDHRIKHASGVNRPQKGSAWGGVDAFEGPGRRVRPQGKERRSFLLDNTPIGAKDYLRPSLVFNPATNTVLWPEPDSILVVEPIQIDSKIYAITRLGLDGTEHWRYQPDVETYRDSFGPYVAGAAAGLLLYITDTAELIGIDMASGTQRYRVRL